MNVPIRLAKFIVVDFLSKKWKPKKIILSKFRFQNGYRGKNKVIVSAKRRFGVFEAECGLRNGSLIKNEYETLHFYTGH